MSKSNKKARYVVWGALFLALAGTGTYGVYWYTKDGQGLPAKQELVRIAFWNIRDLSTKSRGDADRKQICEVLKQFDAIAICEVNDAEILKALESILDQTGEDWVSLTSEKVGNTTGSSERYGVLYRNRVFDCRWTRQLPDRKLADCEIGVPDAAYPDLDVDLGKAFDREPWAVCLKTDDGRLDFALVVVHVTWGAKAGQRIGEVRALGSYYAEVFPLEHDVLVCGDFNRNANDDASLGWLRRAVGLETTTAPSPPTKIDTDNTYDHIMLHPAYTTEYAGTHGVVPFDETMFGNDDAAASKALSDHRPVWIVLKVPAKDDD